MKDSISYSVEEVEKICPGCAEKMKAIGLKQVILPASFFDEQIKKFAQGAKTYADLSDVEIFRVGTWNGDRYSTDDLDKLVSNFDKLKEKQAIPIKIGHSENQDMLKKEGLPAAGWVDKLKRKGDKLVADIKDMPDKIYDLVKNRAYKKVSAEIYPVYKDAEGHQYDKVLRAVALLGGDIPAVEGLSDVAALYKEGDKAQEVKVYFLEENLPVYKFTVREFKKRRG